MRVGTLLSVATFPEAQNPSYLCQIDFGPLGIKQSSAQLTERYQPDELVGQQIIAVVNLPPKQIAVKISSCLILGTLSEAGSAFITPATKVENGVRIG